MRNCNSHTYEYARFCATKPKLAYDGTMPFAQWQAAAEEKLMELLGLPLEQCDPMTEIAYIKETDTHTEYRMSVQTEPGYFVPCHLLLPKNGREKVGLTICLSGHGTGMHIALGVPKTEKDEETLKGWPHRAMAPRAIRDGRAALVVEARNFGESSLEGYGNTCTEAAKIAILAGRTVIGERVWDAMRILDVVLERFDRIDREDIACTGNSGGGTATYYLACLEKRITLAAPSCAVCSFETSIAAMPHCMCNHVPGIRKYFEMGDLGGLIAPRPLIVAAGVEDAIFPIEGTRENFKTIQRLYAAAGAPQNCALVEGPSGHYNYADQIWEKARDMGAVK